MTIELSDKIIANMLKARVYDAEYSELCMDLLRYFNNDVSQIFNGNYKGAFEFSIK